MVGFWADMEHPYITYENDYIESVWWALTEIWKKGLLYKVAGVLFILFVLDFVFAVLIPTGVRLDVERTKFACDLVDNYINLW